MVLYALQGISKVRALFLQDCIPLICAFESNNFRAIPRFQKDIQATVLKVQTLIINLQGFTDPPVWRAIFFPVFNKGREILKHSEVESSDACTIWQISHFDSLLEKHSFFSLMEILLAF